jgi:hypothetical protein
MDNYFILSPKVGDKWTKVISDMKSVKLGTCIHIMGDLTHLADIFHGAGAGGDFFTIPEPDHHSHHHFHEAFTMIHVHTQLSSQ